MTPESPVIYLDGECLLCHRAALFVSRRSESGQFRFALLQENPDLVLNDQSPSLVVRNGGEVYREGRAVLFIASRMRSPYPRIGRLLSSLPMTILNRIYRMIARHRFQIGGKKACALPKEIREIEEIQG